MCGKLCGFSQRLEEVGEQLRKGGFVATSVILKGTGEGDPKRAGSLEEEKNKERFHSLPPKLHRSLPTPEILWSFGELHLESLCWFWLG